MDEEPGASGQAQGAAMQQLVNLPPKMEHAFELSVAERRSPTWLAIEEHYNQRLNSLRAQNDTPQGKRATAALRGRIAEVKELLKLGKEKPTI